MYESTDKMVSHPSHYQTKGGLEVIDVIKAFTEDLQGIQATDTGNIIKYACRWNKKGTPIRDVEKIIWYATHLLEELKNSEREKKRKDVLNSIKNNEVVMIPDGENDEKPDNAGILMARFVNLETQNGVSVYSKKEDDE